MIATLTPILDLPVILASGFAFMLVGGYPLIMLLAWAYQLTHQTRGWEKHNVQDGPERSGMIFNILIGGIVGLSIAILLLDIFVLRQG